MELNVEKMLQEIEDITPTKKKIKINIPADVVEAEVNASYERLNQTVDIPGFRRGKVPLSLLKKRFGKDVEYEVIRKIVPEYYTKAIEESRLEPIGYPLIEDEITLTPSQPLTFSATIEVKPEIKQLSYEGIEIEERIVSVKDEDVEEAIRLVQEERALYSVTEDGAGEGDMVVMYCDASIDGRKYDEFSYDEYPFIIGSDALPKEFTEALIGRKKGDHLSIKVPFDVSNPRQDLAGREMLCDIHVKEVKKKNLPQIDDDFAKSLGAHDLDELRKRFRDDLEKRTQDRIKLEYKRELLDHLIKNHDLDLPDSLVEAELNALVIDAKQKQPVTPEGVKTDEELRHEYLMTARENVKGVLLIEAIGKREGVEVSDYEVRRAIEEMASRNKMKPEDVMMIYMMQGGSIDTLRRRLYADKVLDLLLEKAVIKRREG